MILFGVRGKNARTRPAGRRQEHIILSQKREHSRKPDEQYPIIEACSPGPYIELFARRGYPGWVGWGNRADEYTPAWDRSANRSQSEVVPFRQRKLF
jgi:N6-adenosine-specific RNA methylase IME4